MSGSGYIYHGSKIRVDVLEPSKAFGFGGEADCQNGVYGVENRNLAIPFCFTLINIKEDALFNVKTESNPPEVILKSCEIDWGQLGFLYKLPKASFKKVDTLQWVSPVSVEPIDMQPVDPNDYKKWVKYL